jgi:hypothetical protein
MKTLAMLGVIVLMTGCGIQPLSVWRVSRHGVATPQSCYSPNTTIDSTETWDAEEDLGIFEIYEGPSDTFYLAGASIASQDCNGTPVHCSHSHVTVPGKLEGGVYKFNSLATADVKTGTGSNTAENTISAATTISLTLSGDTFDGKWTEAITRTCNGTLCGNDWATNHPGCTYEYTLKGSKVDADNFYVVNIRG